MAKKRYRVRVDVKGQTDDLYYVGKEYGRRAIPATMAREVVCRASSNPPTDVLIFIGDDTYVRATEIVAVYV